jgi:two-component system, cell cycle response regulator
MRILIAEDDFTSRTVLASLLKKSGHDVVVTVNGMEALKAMRQPDYPPLAILDWMMPEMDGVEVVRQVRTMQIDRPPYIIILTSRDEEENIIAGLDAGANDYLAKPFNPGELLARVESGRRMIEMQDALIESRNVLTLQASHDPLTGLLNRRAIFEYLHKELMRSGRHGNGLAIGMCDIDHFKHINDTYGHQTGDEVLCAFAQILREGVRDYDGVGRIGGEEFVVIASMNAGVDCSSLFERLCSRVAESSIKTRSGFLTVTVSIGVACAVVGRTVDEILEAADTALYRAKDQGRNRVVYEAERDEEGAAIGMLAPV